LFIILPKRYDIEVATRRAVVPIHIWISACLTSRRTAFRKTVATLVDDSGLSARIGADQLGHARPSMTQDVYISRGQVHTEVADVLDKEVGKSDE